MREKNLRFAKKPNKKPKKKRLGAQNLRRLFVCVGEIEGENTRTAVSGAQTRARNARTRSSSMANNATALGTSAQRIPS